MRPHYLAVSFAGLTLLATAMAQAQPAPAPERLPAGKGGLRLHFISPQDNYLAVGYDIFT